MSLPKLVPDLTACTFQILSTTTVAGIDKDGLYSAVLKYTAIDWSTLTRLEGQITYRSVRDMDHDEVAKALHNAARTGRRMRITRKDCGPFFEWSFAIEKDVNQ